MPFQLKPNNRNAPDDVILADLRRVAAMLPQGQRFLYVKHYTAHGRFGISAVQRRFGTWNNALIKAGLPVGKRHGIPDQEMFEHLLQIWRRVGRQPACGDWDRVPTTIAYCTYIQRFGSWRNALEAFAAWVNQHGRGDAPPPATAPPRKPPTPRFAPLALRYRVMRRDGFKCTQCGRSPATETGVALHVDHIIPWADGGTTRLENLQTLCERCNFGKSSQPPRERATETDAVKLRSPSTA